MSFIDPFQPVVLSHPRLPLTAHVLPLGLNITRLIFRNPSTGETHDVIASPEDPKDHWTKGRTFIGPLVGRYANRLPAGKSQFAGGEIDIPEFSGPGVCLHGGPEVYKELPEIPVGKVAFQKGPLDRMIWTKIGSMHSQLFTIDSPSHISSSSAIFAVISEADSNGFPGAIRIETRVALQPPFGSLENNECPGKSAGVLRVEYRAQIIDDCPATPFNITQHWGFNLSASDPQARAIEKGTTNNHLLRIKAMEGKSSIYTLGLDDKMIPTGKLILCEKGGEHDWLQEGNLGLGRPLKESNRKTDYDHFYVWGRLDDEAKQERMEKEHRLILHSPSTNLTLAFKTNQSGTQIYHAIGQPEAPAPVEASGGRKKQLHEDNSESPSGYSKYSSVVLEFAQPHATFLHEEYQKIAKDDTILRKHQRYRNWVEVEVYKG